MCRKLHFTMKAEMCRKNLGRFPQDHLSEKRAIPFVEKYRNYTVQSKLINRSPGSKIECRSCSHYHAQLVTTSPDNTNRWSA